MTFSIVAVVVFAIIVIFFLVSGRKGEVVPVGGAVSDRKQGDDVEKNKSALEKKSLKLMSYEDALAASKQFIYDITRAVIQRFTPDSQQSLMNEGRRLYKAGMEYFHVVDIMALSLAKTRSIKAHSAAKDQSKISR